MQYTVADKIEGNPWAPVEHNLMKQAINSKLDAAAVLNDPNSTPSATTVWSSSMISTLITQIVGSGMNYKGDLSGSENLNTSDFKTIGFWVAKGTFFENPVHATFPVNEPGVLTVKSNDSYVLQEYTSVLEGNLTYSRAYNVIMDTWSGWRELAITEWVQANFEAIAPTIPPGTPTIAIGSNVGILVDIHDSNDLKGWVSITNNTGNNLTIGTNILITYQYAHPGVKVILLEGLIDVNKQVAPYAPPSSTSAVIRIIEDIPNGGVINFFYLIQ